ncbi:class I SAM-dependent methyltransferase [Vreelandella andesensis]|nr:class I SAM-dependent methyltransferase [Halomonas andesensis]
MIENINSALDSLGEILSKEQKKHFDKVTSDLIIVQNRLYQQLESLSWLQRRLSIKGSLPPLRGWAMSPDILLRLHTHIMQIQPKLVVELGCGASTVVIADALRQNGCGKLISLEHLQDYANSTLSILEGEGLSPWVTIRVGQLETWKGEHFNTDKDDSSCYWYSPEITEHISEIDLLVVDGPPAATCQYARYPALPALSDLLSPDAEIWVDDTIRQEEQDICKQWSERFDFILEFYALEKGLGILRRH